jgi:mono/diheme cytochrome c family protein
MTRRVARDTGAALAFVAAAGIAASGASAQDLANGAYVARLAGCAACHTEAREGAPPYGGGRELKTPFGSFYGPNITPHPVHGIGRWSEADFRRAMRQGVRPDGQHYFPAFPYGAFARMSDRDLTDLWAHLRRVPPSDRPNRDHAVSFPFNLRPAVLGWKLMNFAVSEMPDGRQSGAAARGAYIVEALAHCGECHTPRNWIGGLKTADAYAGGQLASGRAPNITPHGIGKWSDADLKEYLATGMTPDGDFAGGEMADVVRGATSALSADDMAAVVAYLRTLAAKPSPPDAK